MGKAPTPALYAGIFERVSSVHAWPLTGGPSRLQIGYRRSAVSGRQSAIGNWLSAIGCRLSAIGDRASVGKNFSIGYRVLIIFDFLLYSTTYLLIHYSLSTIRSPTLHFFPSHCFTIFPPFITNLTFSKFVMSFVGSKSTAMISANFPSSSVPMRSPQPSRSAALEVAA